LAVVLVVTHDTQLADNDMMQRLSPRVVLTDTSWIRPGRWPGLVEYLQPDWGRLQVGHEPPTYRKYIDFAAANRLEYIIIDEGWCGKESLVENLSPAINLEELVAYGNQKGVGIILWASWRNLQKAAKCLPKQNRSSVIMPKWDQGLQGRLF
jgi:alpha-glucosidase